ncbi:MAG: prepilin-type cleavage/methylation domain-containing protein [Proteobacteria bacterium]|nr:prepilin-type cleavage/methylation domain-containing protein [Pseudomonadota bacterium]NOG59283.1 prepilin-type cleavage/methylation domain-containing protein [Pseudomonadota bacterium]
MNNNRTILISRHKAFTIIEFGAVLVIISLFVITFSPAMLKMADNAKTSIAIDEIEDIQINIDEFFKEKGRYPDSLEEVFGEVPLDEWGNPYQYLNLSTVKGKGKRRKDKNLVPINSDYDLYSMGPDGKSVSPLTASASKDDIVRGRNGAFIGIATDY